MNNVPSIGIIGCGIMGSAIIEGLLKNKVTEPEHIFGCDLNQEKREALKKSFGIQTNDNPDQIAKESSIILLAVKPQFSEPVFESLKAKLDDKLVISIMAGVSMKKIKEGTEATKLVRVMPNTPAAIGEGVSAWFASENVSAKEKETVKTILSAIGKSVEVENEDFIDKATAITGSGPAYIFYLAEQIMETAKEMGFNETQAKEMVEKLFTGSVHLWKESKDDPATLRQNVTSKGGTTEAALNVMNDEKMPEIVKKALFRAYERAKELSG